PPVRAMAAATPGAARTLVRSTTTMAAGPAAIFAIYRSSVAMHRGPVPNADQGRHVMSTPTGRPDRPASVFDYAPKHVREQWDRGEAYDAADAEFADDPPIREDDPAQAESGREADERVSSLVPKGAHEDADHEADDAEYIETQSWERDDAD